MPRSSCTASACSERWPRLRRPSTPGHLRGDSHRPSENSRQPPRDREVDAFRRPWCNVRLSPGAAARPAVPPAPDRHLELARPRPRVDRREARRQLAANPGRAGCADPRRRGSTTLFSHRRVQLGATGEHERPSTCGAPPEMPTFSIFPSRTLNRPSSSLVRWCWSLSGELWRAR